MPSPQEEFKRVVDDLGASFNDYKSANDEALKLLAKGESVSELQEKTDKIEKELEKLEGLQKDIEDVAKKAQRTKAAEDETPEVADHREAYKKFLLKGDETGLEELQKKALSTGVDADGGYSMPDALDREIMQIEKDANPMRGICGQVSVRSSEWKKLVSANGAASGWVGETATRPETNTPTLNLVALSFGELYANPATTQKALDELVTPVESWLAEEVGYTFADDENLAFTSGNGTNKPKGPLAYTLSATPTFGEIKQFTSAASGVFDFDDFIDLEGSIKAGYRNNASLVAARSGVTALRKIKDTTGNYLWQPSLQLGTPAQMGGYGIVENEDMPAFAAGANAFMFGDFRRFYLIADVFGTRVLRDPYTNKPYVHFYTTKRLGGGVVDSTAAAVGTVAA